MNVQHISREEAIELFESHWWLGKTAHEIVQRELFTDKCTAPWRILKGSMLEIFGRQISDVDIYRNLEGLRKEFLTLQASKE